MRETDRKTAIGIVLGVTVVGGLVAAPVQADSELPGATPVAQVTQQIGTAEVAVQYGSPAVRGRRIWGALVAYDRPWAISPDQPTLVKLSEDVLVAGRPVAAGTYRLSSVPGKASWIIVLSPYSTKQPGPQLEPVASAGGEVVQVKVPVKSAPFRERLAFLFSNFDDEHASLDLEWERARVSIPIATRTGERIGAEMKRLDGIWRSYANAARFMLESEKDFDAGLKYADQSLALKQDWYTYWIKAALLAAKHDYRAAFEQGQRAHDLGRQQLGDGFVSERELERTLAVWKRALPARH